MNRKNKTNQFQHQKARKSPIFRLPLFQGRSQATIRELWKSSFIQIAPIFFYQGEAIETKPPENASFREEITQIRAENSALSLETPLLISASAKTNFEEIRNQIRIAATAGIYKILFLVRDEKSASLGVVWTELPTIDQSLPKIEPFFLQIDSAGRIYSGSGPGRELLVEGGGNTDLSKLFSQLELYSAAAQSAGVSAPACQIYIDPQASYQRVIDLISLSNQHKMHPLFTNMLPEPHRKPTNDRIQRKPSPPSSQNRVKPLDLAPKKTIISNLQ